jgi:hypothetical protein
VEIKCQLDATDEFLLQILLLAQHVSDTFMPIIRGGGGVYTVPYKMHVWLTDEFSFIQPDDGQTLWPKHVVEIYV